MNKTLLSLALLVASIASAQVTIGSGTAVDGNAGLTTPISNWYATSLSQTIYLASEINETGNITGIQFTLNGNTALTNSNDMIDVYIGHTAVSAFNPMVSPTGADWIPIATHQQVMTNGSLTQSGNVVTFTFSAPFAYNGTDNLVITIDANEPGDDGSGILFYQGAVSQIIRSLMIRTDNAANNANPSTPPLNYTGTFSAESVQAKTTRPIITLLGIPSLGISESAGNTVSIYPNPATTTLNIASQVAIVGASFYNVVGQKIGAAQIDGNQIDVNSLASGAYFITFNLVDNTTFTTKFIKQ